MTSPRSNSSSFSIVRIAGALALLAACAPGGDEADRRASAVHVRDGYVDAASADLKTDPSSADVVAAAASVAPPSPMRRLTAFEYRNAVRDLVGETSDVTLSFTADERPAGFNNNSEALINASLAQQYADAAELIAGNAITQRLATIAPCVTGADAMACLRTVITRYGRRIYRRPLTDAETTAYLALGKGETDTGGLAIGIKAVLTTMLQSPYFLYRVELGDGPATATGAHKLTGYELATRLAFLLWRSTPDDALLDAAAAGRLDDPAGLDVEARRLLADARAQPALREFFTEWLGLARLATVAKDAGAFPDFPALRTSMLTETTSFLDYVVWQGDARFPTLFIAPFTFVDAPLASYYGLPAPSAGGVAKASLATVPLRRGLLTQGSLLSLYAHEQQTSPVLRGKFVREQLLCQPVAAPPADAVVSPPTIKPGTPTRELFKEHRANPSCAGCHTLMDPLGLGFEGFDAAGRIRSVDQGQPVDASGEITGAKDADGTFNGAADLGAHLAASSAARDCFAKQWYRFAMGRLEATGDARSLAALLSGFATTGGDIKALVLATTRTEAFSLVTSASASPAPPATTSTATATSTPEAPP